MSFPKKPRWECKKLRDSAAHAGDCMGQGPTCTGGSRNDICWRHSNSQRHGKGMGVKAHDLFGFYGCQACEDFFVGLSKVEAHGFFLAAWERSMILACEMGAIPTGPKG